MEDERRRNLRDMLDELDKQSAELEKTIEEAIKQSLSSTGLLKEPFVAGLTMRVGPDGKPIIEYFGDRHHNEEGFRTPIYEQSVDDKAGNLRLLVEIPGVPKDDIEISAVEQRASITAQSNGRKYKLEIPLKRDVDPDSGKATYENGILNIVFSLREKTNKGYRRVRIV
jgi:HSP20 family protein